MGCSSAKCFVVIVVDGFSGCSLESLFVSEMERCTHWQEAGRQGNIQGLDLMNNKWDFCYITVYIKNNLISINVKTL